MVGVRNDDMPGYVSIVGEPVLVTDRKRDGGGAPPLRRLQQVEASNKYLGYQVSRFRSSLSDRTFGTMRPDCTGIIWPFCGGILVYRW